MMYDEDICSGCGIPILFGHCDCSRLIDLYEKLEELDITESYFDENEDICPEEDEVFDVITENDQEEFISEGESMTYMEAKALREFYSDMNKESWIIKEGTWDS